MLAARGIPETPQALAGAMLEGEADMLLVAFVRSFAKAKKKAKKK